MCARDVCLCGGTVFVQRLETDAPSGGEHLSRQLLTHAGDRSERGFRGSEGVTPLRVGQRNRSQIRLDLRAEDVVRLLGVPVALCKELHALAEPEPVDETIHTAEINTSRRLQGESDAEALVIAPGGEYARDDGVRGVARGLVFLAEEPAHVRLDAEATKVVQKLKVVSGVVPPLLACDGHEPRVADVERVQPQHVLKAQHEERQAAGHDLYVRPNAGTFE